MAEDFYSAFMLRGNIGTSTDLKTVTGVGCYSVATGNSSAPGSAAGVLVVLPPTSKPKRRFIKENDWNTYTLVNNAWQGFGSAAIHDVTTSHSDSTAGHVLQVGDGGLLGATRYMMGTISQFLAYDSADFNEVPTNGAGWQAAYAPARRAQAFIDTSGKFYSRFSMSTTVLDVSTPWATHYTTLNKPTAAEVGALPITGGTLTGNLEISDTAPIITLTDTNQAPVKKYLLVNDGGDFRIDEDSTVGNNVLKWSSSTNILTVNGEVAPSVWTNFDARYLAVGYSYSKSESNTRYVQNIQLGAQVSVGRDSGGNNKAAAGYVVTGAYSTYQDSNWEMDNLYCKPLQKYINGAWVTISG